MRLPRNPTLALGGSVWIALNLFVAYQCRFWINSDTIGTLDSVRSLRALDFGNALNGYFGTGFALFLTPIDLTAPSSFLQVHLITTLLLLGAQGLLYASLRALDVGWGLAALLSTAWAATNHATGSAIFITADVALCFWASLYVWIVARHVSAERPTAAGPVAMLGMVHALAGITKAIAFPSFLVLPAGFVIGSLVRGQRAGLAPRETRREIVRFAAAYLIPLLLVGTLWVLACQSTYGRFTLGGTGSYNYARFTEESTSLERATEEARRELLPNKTYWWSDPMLSLEAWDHAIQLDPVDPIRRVGENLWSYLSGGKQLARALVLIGMLCLSLLAFVHRARRQRPFPGGIDLLAMVGFSCVGLYLVIAVYPRHLTYPALVCVPLVGVALHDLQSRAPRFRRWIELALVAALAHGVAGMLYASTSLAPDNGLFRIADRLEEASPGPIGAYLDPGSRIRSHGIIAFLAGRGVAEIVPVGDDGTRFRARFSPEVVLLIRGSGSEGPATLTVNDRSFRRAGQESWKGGSSGAEESIVIYLRPVSVAVAGPARRR